MELTQICLEIFEIIISNFNVLKKIQLNINSYIY